MTYTIDESLNDTDYTAAGDVAGVFGTPRRYESITIHHWGSFGQTHDGVVKFFMQPNSATSAHFVVSDGRIHCLVSPQDASWAAGNAYGNATSIHIECHPEATAGDYATVSWLVSKLREWYGNLPLRPHNSWYNTACPGIWDLPRVDREANAWGSATATPAPAPAPAPKPAPKPAPAPAPVASAGLSWIVDPGDTLGGIADYYGIDVGVLARHNGITNPGLIHVGQRIAIPGPLVWIVDPGDTLAGIAAHYGLDVNVVAANNGIQNINAISVGQVIKIL